MVAGLPNLLPCFLAYVIPSFTCLLRRLRPYSAKIAVILAKAFPAGVDKSIASFKDTKTTPSELSSSNQRH